MIANFSAPTEATKNYTQARAQMKAQGMTDEQINAIMPPEMLALGGVSDPGYREFVLARTRAIQNGQALSPELQDYPTYQASKAAKAKLATDNAADLSDAQGKLAPLNQRIDETNTIVDRIKSNPKLDVALTYLTTTGGAGAAAAAKSGMIDRQTYQAIQDIQQLSGQVYGEGFSSTGSKRTQQEVAAIVSGLSQLKATGMSAQDYIDQALNPLQSHLQRGKANAFGAAGSSRRPVAGTAHEGRSDLFARRSALRRRWRRVGEADRRLGSQGARQASEGPSIPNQVRSVRWRSLGWLQG